MSPWLENSLPLGTPLRNDARATLYNTAQTPRCQYYYGLVYSAATKFLFRQNIWAPYYNQKNLMSGLFFEH